ncbi:Aminoglycoside phosphotransferase [Penicillium malachiteum]|nr:Aminoglycoside phosphotransferase [Penicillium malachiteum]
MKPRVPYETKHGKEERSSPNAGISISRKKKFPLMQWAAFLQRTFILGNGSHSLVLSFIREETQKAHTIPIPVPSIFLSGDREKSPANLGPFVVMEYIENEQSICRPLEKPESDPTTRPILDPTISTVRLGNVYKKLARIVLSLSTLTLNEIGSVELGKDTATRRVFDRPLSYSMNEIVQLGTVPRSAIPNSSYSTTSSYFEALVKLHLSHLMSQRNDSIDSEDYCRRKFVARILFQRIVQDKKPREKWLSHETGPFPIWCDDLRPENVLVDKDKHIVGVVDWEFTYAAPVEFSHSPPWWLLLEKPGYWTKGLSDWSMQYGHRLKNFLHALTDCEDEAIHNSQLSNTQRLSGPMRDNWSSGNV